MLSFDQLGVDLIPDAGSEPIPFGSGSRHVAVRG